MHRKQLTPPPPPLESRIIPFQSSSDVLRITPRKHMPKVFLIPFGGARAHYIPKKGRFASLELTTLIASIFLLSGGVAIYWVFGWGVPGGGGGRGMNAYKQGNPFFFFTPGGFFLSKTVAFSKSPGGKGFLVPRGSQLPGAMGIGGIEFLRKKERKKRLCLDFFFFFSLFPGRRLF